MDPVETNKAFAEAVEADYPILSDPARTTAAAYGVVGAERPLAQRWTFYIGPDGKVLYIDKQVRTSTAGADVAARLAALGVRRR